MKLIRNHKKEGLWAKGSNGQWWTAKFVTFSIHVYTTNNTSWQWRINFGNGFELNGVEQANKETAYQLALNSALRHLEHDTNSINKELNNAANSTPQTPSEL